MKAAAFPPSATWAGQSCRPDFRQQRPELRRHLHAERHDCVGVEQWHLRRGWQFVRESAPEIWARRRSPAACSAVGGINPGDQSINGTIVGLHRRQPRRRRRRQQRRNPRRWQPGHVTLGGNLQGGGGTAPSLHFIFEWQNRIGFHGRIAFGRRRHGKRTIASDPIWGR